MRAGRQWLVLIASTSVAIAGAQATSPSHGQTHDTTAPRSLTLGEAFPEYFNLLDSDKDGLADELEFQLGTNSNLQDTDGDGWPDGAETAAGSDPLAPDDLPFNTTWGVPQIQIVVPGAGVEPEDLILRTGFEPTLGVYTATGITIQITRPAQEQTGEAPSNVTVAAPPSIQITRPGQEKLAEPANVTVAAPPSIQVTRPDQEGLAEAANVTVANPTDINIDWEEEP